MARKLLLDANDGIRLATLQGEYTSKLTMFEKALADFIRVVSG
jgi:hypothetical protein